MDLNALKAELTLDEGKRNRMYNDSLGIPTIGVGHNLNNPISDRAVDVILEDDIVPVISGLDQHIPWYSTLTDARQRVLANMAFQMGVDGLLQFHNTLSAIKAGDYQAASEGMLQSLWARQVPERAKRLAQMMIDG